MLEDGRGVLLEDEVSEPHQRIAAEEQAEPTRAAGTGAASPPADQGQPTQTWRTWLTGCW